MSFISRMRVALARAAVKAAGLTFLPSWTRAAFMSVAFGTLVKEGVKANAAVFACLSALEDGFIEPTPRVVASDGSPIDAGSVSELLIDPNPDVDQAQLWKLVVAFAAISGNAYLWKQRNAYGETIRLWPLSDDQIDPVPGTSTREGIVKRYDLKISGIKYPINKADIIHFIWEPDPERPERGIGALQAAAREVDTDNEVAQYAFSLLHNDAVPRVVVTMVEGEEVTQETAQRLRAQWMGRFGGNNIGSPAFLEAGMKVERLGLGLNELAFDALRKVPEARIAAAFKVPPIVAGLMAGLDTATYSNYAQAREAFTEDTLVPLWRAFESALTHGLKDELPTGARIEHDIRSVRSLQGDVGAKWMRVQSAWDSSLLTRAEAKRELGMEAEAWDDVYKVGLTTTFIGHGDATALDQGDGQNGEPVDGSTDQPAKALSIKLRSADKSEAKMASQAIAEALRRTRLAVSGRMQSAVQGYFNMMADRTIARLYERWPKGAMPMTETKSLADELVTGGDAEELTTIVKRFYIELITSSWGTLNLSMGIEAALDLTDPVVTDVLSGAGKRVVAITETTREKLTEVLKYGNENGWSVDQLVRGDPEAGVPGIRSVVVETYKNRARAIARTELGEAQNTVAAGRFKAGGVEKVMVLDDGFDNSDENCIWINGAIVPLDWMDEDHPDEGPSGIKNPLQHPNCVRAFAPYYGE